MPQNMPQDSINHSVLLLITHDAYHPNASAALKYANAYLEKYPANMLNLFFYGDAASIANNLQWQTADQVNITKQWQALAKQHDIDLPVCVSTALSRGITNDENAHRHQLSTHNLADGFKLVGLSELILNQQNKKIIQF